jgi:hypothetical protein
MNPQRRDPASIREQARRSRRRVLLACLAALAVAAGLGMLLARPAPAIRQASSPAATAPTPTATAAGAAAQYAPPQRWVSLPSAHSAVGGQMPTGFPDTIAGAEAFAAAVVEFGYTGSYSQAEQTAALYAWPTAHGAQDAAQTLAAGLRQWAGLPATGSLPTGAGVDGQPVGVAASLAGGDVAIDVLIEVIGHASTTAAPTTAVTATRLVVVWDGSVSDWRYVQADLPSPLPAAAVGTAAFNAAGWCVIEGSS